MSRNVSQSHQQDQKHKSSKKDEPSVTASNPSLICSRRPSKGASLFVPANYKTATAGTITQERITTSHHLFTNSKSSDCIKRGPIPETEAVKKKVENDLKRILNFAEANKSTNYVEPVDQHDSARLSQDNETNCGAEISAMEVDGPVESSQMINLPQVDTQRQSPHKTENLSSASTRQVSAVASFVTSKPRPKKTAMSQVTSSVHSTFSSPGNDEEYLESEVPVQAAADKFVKELKTKIALMFPNRDIQREISYDLQKLVKQSSNNASSNRLDSTIPFADHFYSNTTRLSVHGKPIVNSTLSAFRPPTKFLPNVKVGISRYVGDTHPYTMVNSSGNNHLPQSGVEIGGGKSGAASFCPDSIVERDSRTAEPIIRLMQATSDSSSDSFEMDDGVGGLTAACCDAFIAEARELGKHSDQRQKYLVQNSISSKHHYRPDLQQSFHLQNLSSAPNNETLYTWMDASPCLPDKMPSFSCPSPTKHLYNTAVVDDAYKYKTDSRCHLSHSANIHSGKGMNSYCSSGALRQSLTHQSSQERHKTDAGASTSNGLLMLREENSHSGCAAGSRLPAQSFLPHLGKPRSRITDVYFPCRQRDGGCFSNFGAFQDGPQTRSSGGCGCKCVGSFSHHEATSGSLCERLATHQLGPHIVQTRQNLQNALDSACRDSGVNVIFKASGDHRSKDDFSSMFEQDQSSSLPFISNPHPSWQKHGTIHTNQVDMQRQARDFLDDLEENAEPEFGPKNFFPQSYFEASSTSAPEAASRGKSSSRPNDLSLRVAFM